MKVFFSCTFANDNSNHQEMIFKVVGAMSHRTAAKTFPASLCGETPHLLPFQPYRAKSSSHSHYSVYNSYITKVSDLGYLLIPYFFFSNDVYTLLWSGNAASVKVVNSSLMVRGRLL